MPPSDDLYNSTINKSREETKNEMNDPALLLFPSSRNIPLLSQAPVHLAGRGSLIAPALDLVHHMVSTVQRVNPIRRYQSPLLSLPYHLSCFVSTLLFSIFKFCIYVVYLDYFSDMQSGERVK